MNHSSYDIYSCCNSPCWAEDNDEPCWGSVDVIDELTTVDGWEWIHACEGHTDSWWSGKYKKYSGKHK
jgi:hypothetical protein